MLKTIVRTRRPGLELVSLVALSLSLAGCAGGCEGETGKPGALADSESTENSAKTAESAAALGSGAAAGKEWAPLFDDPAAVVETKADESAALVVETDGSARLALAGSDGQPLLNRDAKLVFTGANDKTTEVALQLDGATKNLVGKGPALTEDVTAVRYEIAGGKEPWIGFIQLPVGGTKALLVSAKAAGDARATPAIGPHGGAIERVGEDDVEVLVDESSGEARVWLLDVNQEVVKPEGRTIHLYIDGVMVTPTVVDGDVMVAKFDKGAPRRVTILLTRDGKRSVVLAGLRPHMRLNFYATPGKMAFYVLEKDRKNKIDKNPDSPGLGHAKGKTKDDDHGKGHDDDHGKGHDDKGKGHDDKGKGKKK